MSRRLIALGALLVALLATDGAKAQAPVQNYYGVTSTTGAKGFQPVDQTHPLPVIVTPSTGATGAVVNCGGTIVTGGTAQPLFTAVQYKSGFIIEIGANDSNTDSLYFSDGATTATPGAGVAGSWSVGPSTSTAPGGSFTSPLNFPVGAAYFINGATTGDKYKCRVW